MSWHSGELLIVRGTEWRVIRSTPFADCHALDLAAQRATTLRTLLLPFDRPRSPSPRRFRLTSHRRWAREVSSLLREPCSYGSLHCCPSTIDLLPYQLEPALAVLRHGVPRILIADEAGLGKTVEAGLIATEVMSRGLARALIVCPASIRGQWAGALAALFDLAATEADAFWLRRRTRELPSHANPWSLPGVYLASMDFVKRPEALHPLEEVRWDLLIVDEAHGATLGSDRRAAIHALARRSRITVLLTATPHPGDDSRFDALCGIGAEAGSPPPVFFRRTASETQPGRVEPRTSLLAVQPDAAEHRVLRMLDDYTARLWARADTPTGRRCELIATVLRKRSLSCAATLAISLQRRLQLLSGSRPVPLQLRLPLPSEEDIQEDHIKDEDLGGGGLADPEEDRRILLSLVQAASSAAAAQTKLRALHRLLRRIREPAIVFTEYRDTAEHLHQALAAQGHQALLLHGGLPTAERAVVLRTFSAGESLLVATDAASEGLNLHHVCRVVIHFELPWTPSRLHQRRGRVDRIGQTRRVHEIALVVRDSSEQLVLAPLIQRAIASRPFAAATSADCLPESRVAAIVFGGIPRPPRLSPSSSVAAARHTPYTVLDLSPEAREEVARLLLIRRLRPAGADANTRPPRHAGRTIPIAYAPRRRRSARITVVIAVSLVDFAGQPVDSSIVTLRLEHARIRTRERAADTCRQVRELLAAHHAAISAAAGGIARERARHIGPVRIAAVERSRKRDEEMQQDLRSAARELVQAGLFDRRAMRAAHVRQRNAEMLHDDLAARLAWAAGGVDRENASRLQASFEIRAVLVGELP